MAHLVVLEGLNTGKTYPLFSQSTLGAAKDNDIVIKDRRILDYHLTLQSTSQSYHLQTLRVDKTIEINGEKVVEKLLQPGDIITIGSTLLLYVDSEKERTGETESPLPFSPSVGADSSKILSTIGLEEYKTLFLGHSSAGDKLKTIVDVSIAISEIPNRSLLLHQILTILLKEIPADRGFVILRSQNKKWEIGALLQKECAQKEDHAFQHSRAITKKVLTRKMSLLYNPTSWKEGHVPPALSCLSVPLHWKDKLLGLIQLEAVCGYRFSVDDLNQVRKVAQQTGVALENLSTYEQSNHYHRQLLLLEKLSHELSRHTTEEKILAAAGQATLSLFSNERISLFLLEDKRKLSLVYSSHIPQKLWSETRLPLEGSLVGEVFLQNKPVLMRNGKILSSHFRLPAGCEYEERTCILSPIEIYTYQSSMSKENMGVLCVASSQDDVIFTELDLKLLVVLASQIGAALSNARLYEKATVDFLSQAFTRGYFWQCLHEEMEEVRKLRRDLSLVMFDIDHFKDINDLHSHVDGDSVLRQMGSLLKRILLSKEIIGRYGGEEFMILLPQDHENALKRAEEIRLQIQEHPFSLLSGKIIPLSCSFGVSTLRHDDVIALLIERADAALYRAKERGRNCVASEKEIAPQSKI